jgi:hypothetical protein
MIELLDFNNIDDTAIDAQIKIWRVFHNLYTAA